MYPHDPESITIKQTHISVVALVPPFVYKIKKPVDFGFLDFTTLEKRRAACEAEIRLNRRLCADTYLGVVPVTFTDDTLRIDSDGDSDGSRVEDASEGVIDVAVKMRCLPSKGFLHQHAEDGTLSDRRH